MKDKSQSDGVEQNASESTEETRRRLLKGIVAGAPVVASVTSRPVFAHNLCSISGQLSGNASHPGGGNVEQDCAGEGCPIEFWRLNTSVWHWKWEPGDNFNTVFLTGTGLELFDESTNPTLERVLAEGKGVELSSTINCDPADADDIRQFAREAVAALQNSATPVRYLYFVSRVKGMVQDAVAALSGSPCDTSVALDYKDDFNAQNILTSPFCS